MRLVWPRVGKLEEKQSVSAASPASVRRFMKVRLDRVLRIDLGPIPASEALAVGGKVPDFGPFPKWEAPFAPYAPGWWEVFVPKQDGKK